MNEKISVIIPVYNVEKYIEECLSSIINQTYKNLEIICIDDCGTDNSIKIVEEFAKKDDRIIILNYNQNKGVSFARNYGLDNATGEYIYFIDSDDFIDLDYLSNMMENIQKYNLNVVINSNIVEYYENNNNKQFWWSRTPKGKLKINNDTIYKLPVMVWCKLYKKSFLDKINVKFPLNLRFEDEFFHYATLVNTDYIYTINNTSYFYRQNINSFINKNKNQTFDMLYILQLIYKYYKNNNFIDEYNINFNLIKTNLKHNVNKKEYFKLIKQFFTTIEKDVNLYKNYYFKKDLIFFNCILNSNNYCLFKIKYILKKLWK